MSTASIANKLVIVHTMPKPEELPDGSLYGYYSVTLPTKHKIIPYHYVKDLNGDLDTETSFTRKFLKTFPRRKIRQAEYHNYRLARPPLYIQPAILEDAIYLDIKQAYPSIYKYLGWMTDYIRGRYWGVGNPMPYPYPMAWKAGRSYVVTGARHRQFGRYINKGQVMVKPYASQFSNPPLVAGVYDVLSMVARFAQYALKAKYWNVDGGILPAKAEEILIPFLQSIGLEGRVKHRGKAYILSSGYWKIGKHETINYQYNKRSNIQGGDYIPVDKEQAEWIYKNFRQITERNKPPCL